MDMLKKYQPVTFAVGLVEAPLYAVCECWRALLLAAAEQGLKRENLPGGVSFQVTYLSSNLDEAFARLDPLSTGFATRHLLLSTVAGWTAYFNNSILSEGDSGFPELVSAALKVRGIYVLNREETIVRTSSGKWKGEYGAFKFYLFKNGKAVRDIACFNGEPSWEFSQEGKPLAFEKVKQYSARTKRDRFNGKLLVNYLENFGLRPFDENSYIVNKVQPAALIERTDANEVIRNRVQFKSLKQVRNYTWTD